ncbi:hypothetical protein G5C51_32645 [Streptomyces sp. A7024]|uniref:Uncharacterized protein n=1 Tax=Streptomyces coryli TaxID=1128680 RepID=A0A6G4UB68_9ACTN|nr:PPA1309 family protein [Streptomyces coryli]NGN68628.1 hypothetical protein [Streptomyces coryli]
MSNLPTGAPDGAAFAASPLTRAVLEIDEYAAGFGWDQPARFFALVDTAQLRAQEPGLAAQLGLEEQQPAGGPGGVTYTPIEQDQLPAGQELDEFLATVAWPEAVGGCAVTLERLMLPPSAEAALPEGLGGSELADWVAKHPERQEVRMTVGVLRDGAQECAIRLREKDTATEVLTGPELVPGLAQALAATFAD